MNIIVSFDIETLGLVPGIHPMISLGAVAMDADTGKQQGGHFHGNLKIPQSLTVDINTLNWWRRQPDKSWEAAMLWPIYSGVVMYDFANWLEEYADAKTLTGLAAPAAFDLPFVNWYWETHIPNKSNPLNHNTLCLHGYVAGRLNEYTFKRTRAWPERWRNEHVSHIAWEDAANNLRTWCAIHGLEFQPS